MQSLDKFSRIFFVAVMAAALTSCVTGQSGKGGAVALFNGKDLTGWRGGQTFDHRKLLAMSPEERAAQVEKWTKTMTVTNSKTGKPHWYAENNELVNDGFGDYATTERDYGDFELFVDYKTVPL